MDVETEFGKPGTLGRNERERRHFLEKRGEYVVEKRGRKLIEHGVGDQPDWTPHSRQIDVQYSEKDQLDWVSRVRRIPVEQQISLTVNDNSTTRDVKEFTFPRIRCFPEKYSQSNAEWTTYPEGFHQGKKCRFVTNSKPNLAGKHSSKETSNLNNFGSKRKFASFQTRGNIPFAALGDKSYQVPEYSPKFHQAGSTRPVVSFGGPVQNKPDTFVPLQPVNCHSENYITLESRRRVADEMEQVQHLDDWTQAAMLVPPTTWENNRKLINT